VKRDSSALLTSFIAAFASKTHNVFVFSMQINPQIDHRRKVMHIKYKYGKSSCKKKNQQNNNRGNQHSYLHSILFWPHEQVRLVPTGL